MLTHSDKEHIQTLTECVHNVLKGNVKLSTANLRKLKPYKNCLRKINNSATKWKAKQRLFIQKGGFLPLILPIIGSAISGLLTSYFSKK
jgi:hypothetical protein